MDAMTSVPTFFVSRVGEAGDLTAPLEFFPPKGSDELYEALKQAYPLEANLQARMRQAVIDFLLNERQVEEYAASQISSNTSPSYLQSPESSFTSHSTPATSTSQSASPRSSAPAPQQQMMDVWSLPTSTQTKIHHRRNMTDEEKKKYKAKRLTGACGDCKQRRRKCTHDLSKETSPQPASIKKTTKPKKKVSAARDMASKSISTVAMAQQIPVAVAQPSAKEHLESVSSNMDDIFSSVDMDLSFDSTMTSFLDPALNDDSWANAMDLQSDWTLFPDMPIDSNYHTPAWLDNDFNGFESLHSPRVPQHHNQLIQQPALADHALSLQVGGAHYQQSSYTLLGQQHSHGDIVQSNAVAFSPTAQGSSPQTFHDGESPRNAFAGISSSQQRLEGSTSPMSASSIPSLSAESSFAASPASSGDSPRLQSPHGGTAIAKRSRQSVIQAANAVTNGLQSKPASSHDRPQSSAMTVSQMSHAHAPVIAGEDSPELAGRHKQCGLCNSPYNSPRVRPTAQRQLEFETLQAFRTHMAESHNLARHVSGNASNLSRGTQSISSTIHNSQSNVLASWPGQVSLRTSTQSTNDRVRTHEIAHSGRTLFGLIPHAPVAADTMSRLRLIAESGDINSLHYGPNRGDFGPASREANSGFQYRSDGQTSQTKNVPAVYDTGLSRSMLANMHSMADELGITTQRISSGKSSGSHTHQSVVSTMSSDAIFSPRATITAKTGSSIMESATTPLHLVQSAQASAQTQFKPVSFSRINASDVQGNSGAIVVTAVSQLLLLALMIMLARFAGSEVSKGKGFSSVFARMQTRTRKPSSVMSELRCIGIE